MRPGAPMTESLALQYDIASAQSLGRRSRQEDALAVSCPMGVPFGFAVVSDGMGGHAAGDLASRIIVAEVFAELTLRGRGTFPEAADLSHLLDASVRTANDSLRAQIEACPEQAGMGGTVVATALVEGGLQWVSVGDSLLFLVRDGRIERLNADHSMAPQIDMMAQRGMIDAEEARNHPQRNCLTSALTGQAIPEMDCPEERLELVDGDMIVLASDGLQVVPQAELAAILALAEGSPSRDIAAALMEAVAEADDPEQDNTSVVVIKVERDEAALATGTDTAAAAPRSAEDQKLWAMVSGLLEQPAYQTADAAKTRS